MKMAGLLRSSNVNAARERFVIFSVYLICICAAAIVMPRCSGVVINSIKVPAAIQNGSVDSVILDCNFKVEEENEINTLVVKWFFLNDPQSKTDPTLAYQWIPGSGRKPSGLGPLQGRLNLDYRASDRPEYMHRALHIVHPTPDLSGEYRCHVSSFINDDFKSQTMIVYVPEQNMDFKLTKSDDDDEITKLECEAAGLFPKPQLSILNSETGKTVLGTKVQTLERRHGLFNISATADVRREDGDNSPVIYDCVLKIPGSNYVRTMSQTSYSDAVPESGSSSLESLSVLTFLGFVLILKSLEL